MKYLRNKNAPPTAGLVQEFIDTAYDTVKYVADNLPAILEVAQAIEDGTIDDFLSANDIDSLAKLDAYVLDATLLSTAQIDSLSKLNALVLDEEIASEAYVDAAVAGLYEFMGGYDASTNTPDLTTSPNAITVAQSWQVTGAGVFFTANVEPGDQLTATINNPTVEADWSIVNRNIDSAAFATAEQGAKADTALQPGEAATPAQGTLADSATQPGDAVSSLLNDAGYTDDQTDNEIATAYNTVTPVVSQVDAEAGISATAERWTPERVAQAIAALGGGGGGGGGLTGVYTEVDYSMAVNELVYANSYSGPLNIPLPALPSSGDKCSVWDVGDNAHISAIFISGNGEDIELADGSIESDASINMAGGRMDFLYSGGAWHYSYVVQTIQPSTIVTERKYIDIPIGNYGWSSAEDPTYTQISGTQINGGYPPYLNFPASTNIKCIFATYMPEDWDGVATTCDVVLTWSPTSTNTGDVLWLGGFTPAVEGDATSHQSGGLSVIDTAIGTADVYQNTLANFINVFAIAGKPAMFMLQRRGADVSDTFTGGVHLHAITISYMASKTLTAAVSNNPGSAQKTITGTTYTILAEDNGYELIFTNAAAIAVTLPDGLADYHQFVATQGGAGVPTITPATETVNGAGTGVAPAAQYAGLHVAKNPTLGWIAKGT